MDWFKYPFGGVIERCDTIIGAYLIYKKENGYYAHLIEYDSGRIVGESETLERCKDRCFNDYRRHIERAYRALHEYNIKG